MANTKDIQVGIKFSNVQTVNGGSVDAGDQVIEPAFSAADYAGEWSATTATLSPGEFARASDRPTLTNRPTLKGSRMATLKTTCEAVGGDKDLADRVPWQIGVLGCGFVDRQLKIINVSAQSGGTFQHGDVIGNHLTQGSATKLGVFVRYLSGSPNRLVYLPTSGGDFGDTETIANYASPQVSVTASSAASNAGRRFTLVSENDTLIPPSIAWDVRLGGQRHTGAGQRGKVTFRLQHDQPLMMDFEFQGPAAVDATTLGPRTASPVANVPILGTAPRLAVGTPVTLDTYSPVLTQLSIAVDNTLAPRANVNTVNASAQSGATLNGGYEATRITARSVTATVDPEHPAVATKEWYGPAMTGQTQRFYAEIGAVAGTAAPNGIVIFAGPAVQLNGDQEPADRDGVLIRNLTLSFTGDVENELTIDHIVL